MSRFSQKGGLSVDKWFKYKANRCPKPEYFTQASVRENHDVTRTTLIMKPLPYLSRYQVQKLYCTAEGNDDVYTTTEVTAEAFGALKMFIKAVSAVSLMNVFG